MKALIFHLQSHFGVELSKQVSFTALHVFSKKKENQMDLNISV